MTWPLAAAALLVAAATAVAQETEGSDLRRAVELPAHRSLMAVIADPSTTLAPFETDGCSGGMSWSWRLVADILPDFEAAQGAHPPWESCCIVHDRAYHDAAGTTVAEASYAARLAADEALKACVAAPAPEAVTELAERYDVAPEQVRRAYEVIAASMFNAVRFGGGPCSGLPWRWGFGYPGCVPGFR